MDFKEIMKNQYCRNFKNLRHLTKKNKIIIMFLFKSKSRKYLKTTFLVQKKMIMFFI